PTELRFLFGEIETTGKPQSFDSGVQAMVKLAVENDEKRVAQNVLARITGSDAKLRTECVIVGGHMDHNGFDREGDINNGANDNASGTAVAMEIARVMKQGGAKPKRTVIFAAWAGEESGLLGSKYYTENPTFPLEKTVAYINLDMVGHGNGRVRFSGEYYAPEVWALLKAKLPQDILAYTDPGRGGPGGSDHSHFLYNGVPAFATMTAGTHLKYHQSGDEIGLIKTDILQKTGDLVSACVDILAAEPKNLIQPGRRETFWFRYLTLVNYAAVPLDDVLAKRKDVKDPEVDWQLAALPEKQGLAGDVLRVELVRTLFALPDRLKGLSGLGLYGVAAQAGPRGGGGSQTLVLPGLIGANFFQDEPRWLEILGRQGVRFAALDKPDFLFSGAGLSDTGKKTVEAYNKNEVLFFLRGLEDAQAKTLLEALKKPVFLLVESLPGQPVLDLVKKNGAVLGLICQPVETAVDYVRRLDAAKKAVDRENLAVVFWQDLWEKPAQDQVRAVISEMLKAKYETNELQSLFSGTLSRVLSRMRAADGQVRTIVTMGF
ncbi:MAG: M20/M25/M40 family metallo-hydrolase, partial [Candidatus Aminicenantes bacterium]|nr:M20/M25/M40 family metallo-hydrolase [Candidatus Aminicenantes bacterium]